MCCSQVRFIYSPLLVLAGIGEHMLMNFSLFIISVIFSPLSFFFFRSYFLVFFYLGGGGLQQQQQQHGWHSSSKKKAWATLFVSDSSFDHSGEKAPHSFQNRLTNCQKNFQKLCNHSQPHSYLLSSSLPFISCLPISLAITFIPPLFQLLVRDSRSWVSHIVPCWFWLRTMTQGKKTPYKRLSLGDAWHNLSSAEGMFVCGGLLKCHFLCSQHRSHSSCPHVLECLFRLCGADYF